MTTGREGKQFDTESYVPEESFTVEVYDLPIPAPLLNNVQELLKREEVFCASSDDADLYSVLTFRREKLHFGTSLYTLFDRNILTDVLALARPAAQGLATQCSERGRIGAALMVFLKCANIIIEPCIALYENPKFASKDLELQRRADDVETGIYLQIAMGQIDHIPPQSLRPLRKPLPVVDFEMQLKGCQKFRISLMKIAELDISPIRPLDKMERFLQWCHDKFCFLAAPTLLAALHFTPHRQLTILQGLRSPDRQKVLESVQNAVWDIQLIFEWTRQVKKQKEEKTFWLLCSRDRALKRIARIIYANDNPEALNSAMATMLAEHWGSKDGAKIHKMMLHFDESKTDPMRAVNQNRPASYLATLEQGLERSLLDWKPD